MELAWIVTSYNSLLYTTSITLIRPVAENSLAVALHLGLNGKVGAIGLFSGVKAAVGNCFCQETACGPLNAFFNSNTDSNRTEKGSHL